MVAYAFETITAEQALAIKAGDTLTINTGPARAVSVVYQSYDPLALTPEVPKILLTVAGRTVAFSANLVQLSYTHAIVMADGSQLAVGDAGGEHFVGGGTDDGLYGGPGEDLVEGGAGDDLLQGNTGHDTLVGGAGSDVLYGGQGEDLIHVGLQDLGLPRDGGDFAQGNIGNDTIIGGDGADTLHGGQGADFINAGSGDDFVSGDLGDDRLYGGLGSDILVGGAGDDWLEGGFGADHISGGDGHDRLVAQGPEGASLRGDGGNDTITVASAGQDVIWGGEGRDRFEFVAKTAPTQGLDDVIADWEASDILHFDAVSIYSILPRQYSEFVAEDYASALSIANQHISAAGATWVAAQVGADVIVFADVGDPADGADIAVRLVGRSLADISLLNFD